MLTLSRQGGRPARRLRRRRLPPPAPSPPPDASGVTELLVCTDGGDYIVERFTKGVTYWTRYDICLENDGDDRARGLLKAYPELDCWISPDPYPDHCSRQPPDEDSEDGAAQAHVPAAAPPRSSPSPR